MQKISRRSLFGGVAAAAVAAVLPAEKPLRALTWLQYPDPDLPPAYYGFDLFPTEQNLNRPGRTILDDLVDFGRSVKMDGERIPPEDWPEVLT